MTSGVGPHQVVQLYRNLLRYGKQLTLTDKQYFKERVRKEFQVNKTVSNVEDIAFLYKKGVSLLEKKRVL